MYENLLATSRIVRQGIKKKQTSWQKKQTKKENVEVKIKGIVWRKNAKLQWQEKWDNEPNERQSRCDERKKFK